MRALLILMMSFPAPAETTDTLSEYLRFEESSPLNCLFTYFPPFFIQHGIEMKEFIRSRTFTSIRRRYGDRRAVDAIFVRAMQLTNNNTAMALLICTIATFDHRIVGLRIPVFSLFFPLSNESEEEFNARVRHLPSALYEDTPPSGDHDKLQHFFGSSFLTVVLESADPAQRIGDFIEEGEEAVIVEGVLDERDRRANRQGQQFGTALLEDNHRLPSSFLFPRIVSRKFSERLCAGVW